MKLVEEKEEFELAVKEIKYREILDKNKSIGQSDKSLFVRIGPLLLSTIRN